MDSILELELFYRRFRDGERVKVYVPPDDAKEGFIILGFQEDGVAKPFHAGEVGWIVFKQNNKYAVRIEDEYEDYFFFEEQNLVSA